MGIVAQNMSVASLVACAGFFDGRPLLVGGWLGTGDNVGKVLRRAGAFVEVGHVVVQGVLKAMDDRSQWIRTRRVDERRYVFCRICDVAAQMGDSVEVAGVAAVSA